MRTTKWWIFICISSSVYYFLSLLILENELSLSWISQLQPSRLVLLVIKFNMQAQQATNLYKREALKLRAYQWTEEHETFAREAPTMLTASGEGEGQLFENK